MGDNMAWMHVIPERFKGGNVWVHTHVRVFTPKNHIHTRIYGRQVLDAYRSAFQVSF